MKSTVVIFFKQYLSKQLLPLLKKYRGMDKPNLNFKSVRKSYPLQISDNSCNKFLAIN